MSDYDPKKIEQKWQDKWYGENQYKAIDNDGKSKYYSLMEFPYPSGDGLHTGHVRGYTAMDIVSRKRRMEGFNVLYPIGWDAFGLPTENYAIKTGRQPKDITKENTDKFREQFKRLGMSFDWSREINTTDPKYYKWTQWLFLKFLEHGLAYKTKMAINWCSKDKIGLANEEVVNGACERCGTPVEKKEKEQWMLAITKYADRLDKDLDNLDFSERVKLQQKNWIGRSEGAEIDFHLTTNNPQQTTIKVFTTRPDTIFGATYMVLAPEHLLINELKPQIENWDEVVRYIELSKSKTDIERSAEGKEKTGIELKGIKAVNPANSEEIPVFIADYVLPNYGTGAIMAVPAHDQRDFEFANKFNLEIRKVIAPYFNDSSNPFREDKEVVYRDVVHSIVVNPKNGKVLCLEWKEFPWNTFVIGGKEEDESSIDAALREIKEETGYKNLKFIKHLAGPFVNKFYAAHKDINRIAKVDLLLFELENEDKEDVSEEEVSKHNIVWLDKSELKNFIKGIDEKDYEIDAFIRGGEELFTGDGVLINSPGFELMESGQARVEITKKFGKEKISFKLRDWVFSRQRYWGEPIPVVHCDKCGIVPVPEKDLPVLLPEVEKYEPGPEGESPLANISEWVNTTCPQCGGSGKRETDVMPNWAGSSWYFLRYCDPYNDEEFASMEKLKYWMGDDGVPRSKRSFGTGVDWYNGGMEHTTLHLLYSRFWNKFLFDIGLVPTSEPYKKRTSHGIILAEGGEKMSKSKGNVVNPDSIVERLGADTLRVYEMFMGPFEQAIAWSDDALVGPRRFIERVWRLQEKISVDKEDSDSILLNQTIKKVSEDIESLGLNTAVSSLMILVNELDRKGSIGKKEFETLLLLLAPFAPHVSEELWHIIGNSDSIHQASWPSFDASKLVSDEVTLAIQINGKVRATLKAHRDASEDELKSMTLALPEVEKWLAGVAPKRMVIVPGKVVSIVI